jgi:hypothetical protein
MLKGFSGILEIQHAFMPAAWHRYMKLKYQSDGFGVI